MSELTPFNNISGKEMTELSFIAGDAVELAITNCYDLKRVADHLNGGVMYNAFRDCFIKGLHELIALCDMDDDIGDME